MKDRAAKRSPDKIMRDFLTGEERTLKYARRVFRRVPSSKHCKLCTAPFDGAGGFVFRRVGFARFAGNPTICNSCIKSLQNIGIAGAEIPVSMLFADIRGSTSIAEKMSPTDYRAFLDRFYRVSTDVVLANDGLVDKFVGDEVIGLFFGGISGARHSAAAIDAGRALIDRVGRPDVSSIGAIPVGAAVHTGEAFVGSTGTDGAVNDFTALGDAVNSTARLAGEAAAGELLASVDVLTAADSDIDMSSRRTLSVRGRAEPIDVITLVSGSGGSAYP